MLNLCLFQFICYLTGGPVTSSSAGPNMPGGNAGPGGQHMGMNPMQQRPMLGGPQGT